MSDNEAIRKEDNPAKKSIVELIGNLRPGDAKTLTVSFVAIIAAVFAAGVTFQKYFVSDAPRVKENSVEISSSTEVNDGPKTSSSSSSISAGALIVKKRKDEYVMLGVLHIPEGRGMVFSPPAGETEGNEKPTETAHRETLEETGFTIKNEILLEKASAGNTNFSLVAADIDETIEQAAPEKHDGIGMIWADPMRIPASQWRFPEQRKWIIEHYQKRVSQLQRLTTASRGHYNRAVARSQRP